MNTPTVVVNRLQIELQRRSVGGARIAEIMQHDTGTAERHVPVVGLVEVVVETDEAPRAPVAAIGLDHLTARGEPLVAVGLDELPTLVADLGLDEPIRRR